MSTKTTIQTTISNNLADSSDITASEHRTVENVLLDEIYASVVNDDQTTTNVLTADNATDKQYTVSIVKQGRKVTINGFIKNNTASMMAGEVFFNINSGEYTQDANIITVYGNKQLGGDNVRIALGSSTLTLIDTIGAGSTVYFTVTYFTLN